MEVVVALLMFVNFEIKEHRVQPSMSVCLRGKREAERTFFSVISAENVPPDAQVESLWIILQQNLCVISSWE